MTGAKNRGAGYAMFFLLVLFAACPAQARKIIVPSLEELTKRYSIICSGRVIKLEDTLQKGTDGTVPIEFWKARIKVLHTFKGKVPDEIEFRFMQIDLHPPGGGNVFLVNPPLYIALLTDARYRFFLKPHPNQKGYISALGGDFDECYAVQLMADTEHDDNPPPRRASLNSLGAQREEAR